MKCISKLLVNALIIHLLLVSPSSGQMMSSEKVGAVKYTNLSEAAWSSLSHQKIFFGHKSVGYNIVDGVKDLVGLNPQANLNVAETNNPSDLANPVFAHWSNGKNNVPRSKIDAFVNTMAEGIGNLADIAFFKFCYVDIEPDTDIESLFATYDKAMSDLKKRYPRTTFVHVTVPLTVNQTGIKAWIKKILGRPVWGVNQNARRNQYNDLLRQAYKGKAPLFDLAEIESTLPDGTRTTFKSNRSTYYQLASEYTYDGGHLNETGRKKVAEQLLIFLANLSR